MNILGFFSRIFGGLKRVFSSETFRKAETVATHVADLLKYALPAVKLVASMTPTKADDEIIHLIEQFRIATTVDLSRPLTDSDKAGLLMTAAGSALRGEIRTALVAAGGAGLMIGGSFIKAETDIPDNWINTAVNCAYSAWKSGLE